MINNAYLYNQTAGYIKWVRETIKSTHNLLFLGNFFIYGILRLFAWKNTVLLEDTDSLGYLDAIKVFLTFNLQNIINLDPDYTPFYPFFGALFSLPGWSVETGARVASLFFSFALFVAVLGIGRQITKPWETMLGLLMLSFSPVLITLSFGVLTEPSYIATVYIGIWLFWTQYKKPKLWKAALLGVIFGLAFVNRVEGILYLAIIPFLQGAYSFWQKQQDHDFRHYVSWSLFFVICFVAIAIPQTWRVSHKMGMFALNGRQVWTVVINNPDGKSNNEKFFGLDFSPKESNISYLKEHPELLNQFGYKPKPTVYLRTVLINLTDLTQNRLGILIGPAGLIFFGFGLFALYQSGRRFDSFLILAFIGFGLVGPFLHNVAIRHIIIIAPIMLLTGGIGVVYLSRNLLASSHEGLVWKQYALSGVLLLGFIGVAAYSLTQSGGALRPLAYNHEYGAAELEEFGPIISQIAENELNRPPVITAQRGYLAYFVEGKQLYLPFTDYKGLVKFCELNNVDFLYLKHKRAQSYPLIQAFLKDNPPNDFKLIHSGVDSFGEKIELYRFRKTEELSLVPNKEG